LNYCPIGAKENTITVLPRWGKHQPGHYILPTLCPYGTNTNPFIKGDDFYVLGRVFTNQNNIGNIEYRKMVREDTNHG